MTEYSSKQFGENLRNALASVGMTQVQLADKLGTSGASISRYVSGARKVSPEVIVKMALALNVSADSLLGIELKKSEMDSGKNGTTSDTDLHEILIKCYDAAEPEFKTVLWTILDKYLTSEQRDYIHAIELGADQAAAM